MTLNDYMKSQYVDAGREYPFLDCYGLARLVRHDVYGKSLLPLLDGHGGLDKVQQSRDVRQYINLMTLVDSKPVGSLAFAYRRRLCEHIGVVVKTGGKRMVMDTNQSTGTRIMSIPSFEMQFRKVLYYD